MCLHFNCRVDIDDRATGDHFTSLTISNLEGLAVVAAALNRNAYILANLAEALLEEPADDSEVAEDAPEPSSLAPTKLINASIKPLIGRKAGFAAPKLNKVGHLHPFLIQFKILALIFFYLSPYKYS